MRILKTFSACAIALATSLSFPAFAAPAGAPVSHGGMVEQVRGCHRDVQRHFAPELGGTTWHFHRGNRCRAVRADRPRPSRPRDCHSDARRHFVPGYGNVLHRHRANCSVRVLRRGDRYRPDTCVRVGPLVYCEDRR